MEEVVKHIAKTVEKQVDAEIDKLNNLDADDLERIRELRISQMKKQSQLKKEWLANGHGEYTELAEEKEFFGANKKSTNLVCHFYKNSTQRCKIVDMHLKILAQKHVEAKFVKLDVERCPFLTEKLKIRVIPTIALIKDSKMRDYIIGFTDLGNCDDFSTEMLEWRIAQSDVIEYGGDLLVPPDQQKKKKQNPFETKKRTIRDGNDSDDSIEFSD